MIKEDLKKTVRNLEERIRTLEDIEAIQKFHLRYIYLYNNHQYREMAASG